MKLIVLGANGRTGQHVVELALERGMEVTAVVRSTAKTPPLRHERLSVEVGDPCDPAFLKGVLRGQDALISTLGGRRPTKAATAIYPRSAEAIVEAAWDTGLNRVLVTSTALLFREQTVLGDVLRFVVPNIVSSAGQMEETLKSSGLNWTSARPGFLKDTEQTTYRARKDRLAEKGTSVSRLALASFLLDAIDQPETKGAAFGVSQMAA
ncbi:MAG: NAD(P)-binding oxidoreductase [Pseudomonadota bacterium]